ncbi:MAG: flavodoxin family protein [Myxococcales bacterium]|nr:flavodoxin family protein [Myxococcales bacterium]
MKAVVLAALPDDHGPLKAASVDLLAELERAGYDEVSLFELNNAPLAYCQGEFDCWLKTPGKCRAHDLEQDIVAAVHDADALVTLGRLTFGGHGHSVKRAIDRLICLLEPFLEKRAGLTHHVGRYDHLPAWFSVSWAPSANTLEAETQLDLTEANALNFFAPRFGSAVLLKGDEPAWSAQIAAALASKKVPGEAIRSRDPLRSDLLAMAAPDLSALGPTSVRRAAILVGSPKVKGTSASEAMARSLAARLEAEGVIAEIHFATEFVHDNVRSRQAAEAIASEDLFVLVSPLYCDAFPSLTTQALELIAHARTLRNQPARFVLLVNCGFPEPEQNRTALRIARHFAEAGSYAYGGALPVGGGGVVQPGSELREPHGPVSHIVKALDIVAPALARNQVVPTAAVEVISESMQPDVAYRLIGNLGWRWTAHKNGLKQSELHARPLDHER